MTNLPKEHLQLQKLCYPAVENSRSASKTTQQDKVVNKQQQQPIHNYTLSSRQGRDNQRWMTIRHNDNDNDSNNHHAVDIIRDVTTTNTNTNKNINNACSVGGSDVKIRLLAGCVPLTNDGHVIFVSSSKDAEQWILPKGGWEQDETLTEAAKRETYEEAGLIGRLGPQLQHNITYRSKSLQTWNKLQMFPMYVEHILQAWPESGRRNRRLMTLPEGIEYVRRYKPQLVGVLEEVAARIGNSPVAKHSIA